MGGGFGLLIITSIAVIFGCACIEASDEDWMNKNKVEDDLVS